jgi:hypothetical protein
MGVEMRRGLIGAAVYALGAPLMACAPGASGDSDLVLTAWDQVTPGPDDGILVVSYPGSPCASFDHVEVAQSPEAVSIWVYERSRGGTNACSAVGIIREAVVRLPEPLAGRQVTGCRVPVSDPCDPPPAGSQTVEVIEVRGR